MKNLFRFLLRSLAATFLLFSSSAHAEVSAKIINGHDATPGAWPFMVAIIAKSAKSSADGHFCGGSLIGPQHILTAGHCVYASGGTIDPRDIVVQIGGEDLSFSPLSGREVLGVTLHPNFDRSQLSNDLAILKLKEPVTTTPIDLALSSDAALYTGGTPATVIGYGMTDPQIFILPFTLQEAAIPLASDQTCMNEIGRAFNPETMMCAGTKASSATAGDGVDACAGDSGGPLFVSDGNGGVKQVGVVSWGLGDCANQKVRGIYSKIMANDTFVTSFPLAKPVAENSPYIQGPQTPSAGSVLTCVAPSFYGDAPSSIQYRWYRDSNGFMSLITDATTSTYTLSEGDEAIYCSVEALNSAGSSREQFSGLVTINSVSPPPPPADTTKPTGSIRALTCSTRSCSFVAITSDDMSGVTSVRARVELSYTEKASKTKGTNAKRVTITRTVRAQSAFNSVWEGDFRLSRKVRQHVKVTLLVRDFAGNNNMSANTRVTSVLAD